MGLIPIFEFNGKVALQRVVVILLFEKF